MGCDKCRLWGKLQVCNKEKSKINFFHESSVFFLLLYSITFTNSQTQGLGTALKILYSEKLNVATESGLWERPHMEENPIFKLSRTEIVALFNAFGR